MVIGYDMAVYSRKRFYSLKEKNHLGQVFIFESLITHDYAINGIIKGKKNYFISHENFREYRCNFLFADYLIKQQKLDLRSKVSTA